MDVHGLEITHADDDGLSALATMAIAGAMCSPLISPTVRDDGVRVPPQVSSPTAGMVYRFHAVEGVRRPELLGHIALELHRVDGDHIARAGRLGALHGVDAHTADTDDYDGVAGTGPADLGGRSPSRRDTATGSAASLRGCRPRFFTNDAWLTVM